MNHFKKLIDMQLFLVVKNGREKNVFIYAYVSFIRVGCLSVDSSFSLDELESVVHESSVTTKVTEFL